MQVDYDSLFTILGTEREIDVLINPFVNAYLNDVMEQLEGQIAAAKVAIARLSSPQLYYVLSGNDFILNADTSISRSKQLESAIPSSKISALSSAEFAGMIADDLNCKIALKAFHCEILNDHEALKKEQDSYNGIPIIRRLDNAMVQRNYLQIKQDVQEIIQVEMEKVLNDPGLSHLVIRK